MIYLWGEYLKSLGVNALKQAMTLPNCYKLIFIIIHGNNINTVYWVGNYYYCVDITYFIYYSIHHIDHSVLFASFVGCMPIKCMFMVVTCTCMPDDNYYTDWKYNESHQTSCIAVWIGWKIP